MSPLGLLRRPGVILSAALVLLFLVVGSIAPPPSNWARPADARLVDVRVSSTLSWHSFAERWEVQSIHQHLEEPKWFDWAAWYANAFRPVSLFDRVAELTRCATGTCHASDSVVLELRDAGSGVVLDAQRDATGRPWFFTGTTNVDAAFRLVPPGNYVLRVMVVDDAGAPISTLDKPLHIIAGGA